MILHSILSVIRHGIWFVAILKLVSELECDLRDTVDWGRN